MSNDEVPEWIARAAERSRLERKRERILDAALLALTLVVGGGLILLIVR